jgi:hypothetical protein
MTMVESSLKKLKWMAGPTSPNNDNITLSLSIELAHGLYKVMCDVVTWQGFKITILTQK